MKYILFIIIGLFIVCLSILLIRKKDNKNVSLLSKKIIELNKLNKSYSFKEIKKHKYTLEEREYARKCLDRVTGTSIIKYYIENNIEGFRTDIENAIYNIKLLDEYLKEVDEINKYETNNKGKYSNEKFNKIETRVFNSLIKKKNMFKVKAKVVVYYKSNGGNVYDERNRVYSFDNLVNIYDEWKNGHKFEETKKQERKIMNDDIRYNVLKRDNFTCKICGASAKDGAKLHVDHIIPVSKGGKTVMNNLQTLCDRCNIGKSDKLDMKCPKCGANLVERKGKYGKFYGCSTYPKCDYIQKIDKKHN